ncbi:hypothetical protein DKK70_01045 [Gilliamella apicola]|uniref:Uncharacterized protein n=1 Tax=Gilliamella apicola TaxID=1196095 RepID=A0A2V4E568_9GAMM|nr:hypothetical protein [Gilliamella apicola]PXZ08382.1 hypothetical protein DKK70_01045 [Gilliamella apicola]
MDTKSPSGHYWIEIINDLSKMDGSELFIESYGWYPQEPVTFSNSFTVIGCLNSDYVYFRDMDDKENEDISNEVGSVIIKEEEKMILSV